MVEELQRLADGLVKWKHIHNLKEIPTATIPVIKAHVDLRALRKETREMDGEKVSDESSEEDGMSHMLPIDVTFLDRQTE